MSYITPSKVLAHLDRLAVWRAGHRASPVTIEWDLTNVCSLGCRFCHFAHTHVKGPYASKNLIKPDGYGDTGTQADLALVTRVLPELAGAEVRAIVWSGGGEPTLHPHFGSIILAARAAGLEQGMYTLGGHLSEALAAHVRTCMTWVVVSLDAHTAATYAADKGVTEARFHAACDGIRRLQGGAAVVGVSFLLHAENWRQAGHMLALARSLGASYATFRPTIETAPGHLSQIAGDRSWVTDALPMLEEFAEESDVEIDPARFVEYRDWTAHPYTTCYGIRLVTQITPDGRVWICPNRRGIAGSELGDLRQESFAAIWARHPGRVTEFSSCRAMCRLNLVNTVLADVEAPRVHAAFI